MGNEERYRKIQQSLYNAHGGAGRFAPPAENVPHQPTSQELAKQKSPPMSERYVLLGQSGHDILKRIAELMSLDDLILSLYSPPREFPQYVPEDIFIKEKAKRNPKKVVEAFWARVRLKWSHIEDFYNESVPGTAREEFTHQEQRERKRQRIRKRRQKFNDFEY